MVYTVTLNPSLDYTVTVEDFRLGKTNRTASEQLSAGGKGINVSMVLHSLGVETRVLGFQAGFVGEEIAERVRAAGLDCGLVRLKNGCSRINVKIKNYDGTEINGAGPEVGREEAGQLMDQLERLGEGDVLVLAGSIPSSLPRDIYGRIMERLSGRGILFAVDTSGESLLNVLELKPFLIKPNRDELAELAGKPAATREEALVQAAALQKMGAANVLVSLGGDGAVLLDETGASHSLEAPKGTLVNSVGAGDSMVAGFLAGWLRERDYGRAFALAVAAGSASAFSEGLAGREKILELLASMEAVSGRILRPSSSVGS